MDDGLPADMRDLPLGTRAAAPGGRRTHQPLSDPENGSQGPSLKATPDGNWGAEQARVQNPTIRALLGSLRLIGDVDQGVHRIVQCSQHDLLALWRKLEQVVLLLRVELAPLLDEPSLIPNLERMRKDSLEELGHLDERVLKAVDHFPATLRVSPLEESQKILQLAIERLHVFLLHLFGEVMAADPRNGGDADYFLLRKLPEELRSSRSLLSTMGELEMALGSLVEPGRRHAQAMVDRLRYEKMVPGRGAWGPCDASLSEISQELVPILQRVISMPGVRSQEAAVMARHSAELPAQVRAIVEVYEASRAACAEIKARAGSTRGQQEQSVEDLIVCHGVFSRRLAAILESLDDRLAELQSVVPLWHNNIERRRAVLLARKLPSL